MTQAEREIVEGVVTSAKADKTLTVHVSVVVKHPKYEKFLRRDRVFHVHDERNEAKEGDRVAIRETRPLSKTKHWRLVKVLERAKTV